MNKIPFHGKHSIHIVEKPQRNYFFPVYCRKILKIIILIILLFPPVIFTQSPNFYPQEHLRISDFGMGFNIDSYDMNRDGIPDIVIGNWNDTKVLYGGPVLLDSTFDVLYQGRLLTICDYNGDGFKDLIAMHFTSYDSARLDYNGEILFYYGQSGVPAIDIIPEYSIPLPTLYPKKDKFSLGEFRPGVESGDFNNDGKFDFAINSENALPEISVGKLFIYMGSAIPPDSATYSVSGKWIPGSGQAPILYFGKFFQIGDLNNDGYDDLLLTSKILKASYPFADSLVVLHIYMGSDNFAFLENGETLRYESFSGPFGYSYGWINLPISMMDINSDGFSDLIIAFVGTDSTVHVHYGSVNIIDTIPSFYLTDPDTTSEDILIGSICHNVGDWNKDGDDDFLLMGSGFKSFSAHLGGPHISNQNPYGMRGLLESLSWYFPQKALGCGDQNGDGVKDYAVISFAGIDIRGYLIIFKGRSDIVVSVDEDKDPGIPEVFTLEQNYPNPFNPSTTIKYRILNKPGTVQIVSLKIYDILGSEITVLVNEEQSSGYYKVNFDARKYNLTSGIYFCELKLDGQFSQKIKMIYLK